MTNICKECKDCWNYKVCEIGCFGSDKPCEHYVGEDRDEVLKKKVSNEYDSTGSDY